jgi:TMEM175 potassium channel family protein
MSQLKELQRIEAFSDAVFAIACTLLVIEIPVPHLEDVLRPGALWPALKAVWPSLAAFLISFASLLIAWANHHRGSKMLVRSSEAFLYANGFLLLTVTFMPFPTAVLAHYVSTSQANIATVFYSAACLLMNLGFNVLWFCVHRPIRLLAPSVSKAAQRKLTIQTLSGLTFYLCTTALSYWFPATALIIISGVQLLWIVTSIDDRCSDLTPDSLVAVQFRSEQEEGTGKGVQGEPSISPDRSSTRSETAALRYIRLKSWRRTYMSQRGAAFARRKLPPRVDRADDFSRRLRPRRPQQRGPALRAR